MQLWQNNRYLPAHHSLILVLDGISVEVPDNSGRGDAYVGESRMEHHGEVFDGQCEIEKLVHADVCKAHFGLAEAEHNVPWEDLVVHHHSKHVLPLVEDPARRYLRVGKLYLRRLFSHNLCLTSVFFNSIVLTSNVCMYAALSYVCFLARPLSQSFWQAEL